MKKWIIRAAMVAVLLVTSTALLLAWGAWGHEHINRAAVFALPDEMRPFFFDHIDFVTQEAVIPDIRKYALHYKEEFNRHYIDLETYGQHPFQELPETFDSAKAKFGMDTLNETGILPWYIQQVMEGLTTAFKQKRKTEILFLAGDIGHYLADATVPLHTSLNHDGQLTGQKGIHAFWESQLPEMFGKDYDFHVRKAKYIKDPAAEIWNIIRQTHGQVDSVLLIEKRLSESFPADKKYEHDQQGAVMMNVYHEKIHSKAYTKAYHDALHGMVENQMRLAIEHVADFWYTAWVNAGKPNLNKLDPPYLLKLNKREARKEYKLWEKGHLKPIQLHAEF